MALVIRTPQLQPFRSLLSDVFNTDRIFPDDWVSQNLLPAVNVSETDSSYQIELAAPGYKKEDFTIDLENNILTISAEAQGEQKEENKNYTRKEFSYSSFSRAFTLPENVKGENIQASYENGVLKVIMNKKPVQASQRTQISVI